LGGVGVNSYFEKYFPNLVEQNYKKLFKIPNIRKKYFLKQHKTTSAMPIHQGKKLKKAVDDSKLRVKDIAEKAQIPISSLYDIFKKEDVPRKKLEKLCEVLEVNLDEMYFESQELSDPNALYEELQNEIRQLKAENLLHKQRTADLEQIIRLMNERSNAEKGNAQQG
jgi:DNA-binding Xre family transcriptional regulator